MNGWNGCDLQLCYLVQFIFTGVGQYIRPIIATNYGGGNCGVIHQCHVFEIFSDIRVLRKNSEDEVTDSKYVSSIEHYSMVNFKSWRSVYEIKKRFDSSKRHRKIETVLS